MINIRNIMIISAFLTFPNTSLTQEFHQSARGALAGQSPGIFENCRTKKIICTYPDQFDLTPLTRRRYGEIARYNGCGWTEYFLMHPELVACGSAKHADQALSIGVSRVLSECDICPPKSAQRDLKNYGFDNFSSEMRARLKECGLEGNACQDRSQDLPSTSILAGYFPQDCNAAILEHGDLASASMRDLLGDNYDHATRPVKNLNAANCRAEGLQAQEDLEQARLKFIERCAVEQAPGRIDPSKDGAKDPGPPKPLPGWSEGEPEREQRCRFPDRLPEGCEDNFSEIYEDLLNNPEKITLSGTEAAEVAQFLHPDLEINQQNFETNEYRAAMLIILYDLINASQGMSVVESTYQSSRNPSTSLRRIIRQVISDDLKRRVSEYFSGEFEIYDTVVNGVNARQRPVFDAIRSGVGPLGEHPFPPQRRGL